MKEQVSKSQLLALIIIFEIGSSSLFELGINARQDAWIVILVAMAAGLVMLWVFTQLQINHPDRSLIGILQQQFGKWIGMVIGGLYAADFIYESMRNVRDFGDLSKMYFLAQTPISLIMFTIVLLAAYAILKGLEVFFRIAEFLFPWILLTYTVLILFIFLSGKVNGNNLLPVLENGVSPVLKAAFPAVVTFPFSQMVLFLMFWKHLNEKQALKITSYRGVIIAGLILTMINAINIAVLGVTNTSISQIPLLHTIRLISIGEFIERLDALAVLLLFLSVFFKLTCFFLGAVLALGELTKTSYRKWILPAGAVILFTSFLEPNYVYHIWLGLKISTKYIHVPFQILIPILLLATMWIRSRFKVKL